MTGKIETDKMEEVNSIDFIQEKDFYKPQKHIFVINGSGGVGKDTFVKYVSKYINTWNYSSIDSIKKIAKMLGWKNIKDEKSRKFLSDLKMLSSEYNDFPLEQIKREIKIFYKKPEIELLFIHCREPKEIEKIAELFDIQTILIKNPYIEKITSNEADANVENFTYHYSIANNGTLEDLDKTAKAFVNFIKVSDKSNQLKSFIEKHNTQEKE